MTRAFGKYRLLERLGGGGMAEVWRAEVAYTEDVSRTVALKMIREDLASQKQFHSLFIDEARITSRISHTNVAQVLDFGDEGGRPFLAIELVQGADLYSIMAAAGEQMRSIPLDVAAFIVAEVARGLDHAHTLADEAGEPYGIVHRDVSPQNVLVSYAGEVKVTDFGIARARDKVTQTETGTVMGKFRYMSPEQVRGEEIDARSDIFSCGILLYELVTGKQLFDGRTSAQVVDQIRYDELPGLSASRPDVDPALDTVLRWTLERELDQRCPDAATLSRDLERYVHVAHPQFTRERVAELLESLMPRKVAQPAPVTEGGHMAYAGTELAPSSGPEPQATESKAAAPKRPMRSLADLEAEDSSAGEPEPDTTAPAKRLATPKGQKLSTVVTNPSADAVPAEAMEGVTEPPHEADRDVPAPTGDAPPDAREETLTLARRKSISASGPIARDSAPHDAPTRLLDEDPAATDRTRARRPEDVLPAPDGESASQTETRTAGRARGEAAPRPADRARRRTPRKKGRGVETTLGIVLALLLLGGVTLLLLHTVEPKGPSKGEPGASAMGAPAGPGADGDAGAIGDATTDATAPAGDGGAQRIATLDQAIAALRPEGLLSGSQQAALLARLDRRLIHATVNDEGERRFGHPCGAAKLLPAARRPAEKLADLYAERLLLDPALPKPVADAVSRQPPSPRGTAPKSGDPLVTLRTLLSPKAPAAQEALILARGRQGGWCPPLAGQAGLRYLLPHVVVARDAVARLLHLQPSSGRGRLWRRYLEAAPRGKPAALGSLSLRLKSNRHQVLKKDDNQVFFVTLTVKNEHPDQGVKLQASGFKLHGVGTTPLKVGLWKPDLGAPLTAGQTVTLELTFAAPLGPPAPTLVLSVPRASAGSAWLQVSSSVMPTPQK